MMPLAISDICSGLSRVFPINTFTVDQAGLICWANVPMIQASGVSTLNEIKGKHVRIFGEKEWLTTHKVISSGQGEILFETHQEKTFLVIKTPHSEKEFQGVLGLSIDITALEQAKKAKQSFIENMSHDLRTPFTGVYSVADMLYQHATDEKTKTELGYIVTSAQQWMDVVNSLFEVFKTETLSYEFTHFDIQALLYEIQAFYGAAAYAKGLQLTVHCESQLIYSQRLRLKQILINLMSNAIKFTEEGGVIVSAVVTEEWLTLQVSDTGIGIPEEKQDTIFEKFTKLKPSGQNASFVGAGLGLYLAKQCAQQLGGNIALSSQRHHGSRFQVKIPLKISGGSEEVTP